MRNMSYFLVMEYLDNDLVMEMSSIPHTLLLMESVETVFLTFLSLENSLITMEDLLQAEFLM